jgi:hypothetical protein
MQDRGSKPLTSGLSQAKGHFKIKRNFGLQQDGQNRREKDFRKQRSHENHSRAASVAVDKSLGFAKARR